jgi:hypothetical protein
MDDNLGILGSWGESWIAYDQDGMFFDLFLTLGQGYYLALAQSGTLLIEGDPVVSSDFSLGDLDLQKGWTLKSNPLVNIVDKGALEVVFVFDSPSRTTSNAPLSTILTKGFDFSVQPFWRSKSPNEKSDDTTGSPSISNVPL